MTIYIFFQRKMHLISVMDIFTKNLDIKPEIVPVKKQSVDMHLVSYLGYVLGQCNNKQNGQNSIVIVSKDTDYDNIIKYWKEKGYQNISRIQELPTAMKKQQTKPVQKTSQTTKSKTSTEASYKLSGQERSKLNTFMQKELSEMGYLHDVANRTCKIVIEHCNDENRLREIHNDLRNEINDYFEVYNDVKQLLDEFNIIKSQPNTNENQVRLLFDQHFRKKVYVEHKEEIVNIITKGKTKQQINSDLLKLLKDGKTVKLILQTMKPIIKDLPNSK